MPNPKVPTALKMLKGTNRKDRVLPDEVKPDACLPPPPARLAKDERAIWRDLAGQLFNSNVLTKLDGQALEIVVRLWARLQRIRKESANAALVEISSRGETVAAYIRLENETFKLLRGYLSEFGMTPASRTKVSTVPAKPKTSKWAM